jgi:hypothetical protein
MKKWLLVIVIVATLTLMIRQYFLNEVAARIHTTLARYDIQADSIKCKGGVASREGHCRFRILSETKKTFKAKLLSDLSVRKPEYQSIKSTVGIGDGACSHVISEGEHILPTTQLGGGMDSLPYLGDIYIEQDSNYGCLEFAFGYG